MILATVLRYVRRPKSLRRRRHTLDDPLVTTMTYGDLETAWLQLASPANRLLVPTFVTAIWKQSRWVPEEQTLVDLLEATIHLAAPDYLLGSEEAPTLET